MATLSLSDTTWTESDRHERLAPLRVLQVVNGEHYAGAERVQDLLAGYLPQFRVETQFVCVKHRTFDQRRVFRDARLEVIPVSQPWPRRAAAALAKKVRQEDISLLHAHTPRSLWLAHRAAQLAGVPLVYTSHDISLSEPVSAARRLIRARTITQLRQVDVVIAVSPAALVIAEQLRLGKQRLLIPNGVAERNVTRTTLHTPPTVGTVALIRPRKGIETLIGAVGLLRTRGSDVRLRLVGPFETEEYERVVRRAIDRAGISDAVSLPGFTQDVNAELDALDVFVMPSVLPEGTPMVVLEAMAAGLPVAGSRIAGVADLIRHGVDGMLAPPGDARALAEAIDSLLANPSRWCAMSEQVRRRQQALFSATVMAERTRRAYDLALGCG